MLVYKQLKKMAFVTNGYDYWFGKKTSIEDAALVTLCDFFNCRLASGMFFNKLTAHRTTNLNADKVDEVFERLNLEDNVEKNKKLQNGGIHHERPKIDREYQSFEKGSKTVKTVALCYDEKANEMIEGQLRAKIDIESNLHKEDKQTEEK